MADQITTIRAILSEAGVEDTEEIANKIVALFPKSPVKRSRNDLGTHNTKRANISTEPDSTTFKFCVTNNDAGSIIGKGGSAISALRQESGALVKLSQNREYFPGTENRVVMAEGAPEKVLKAFRLVIERRYEIYEASLDGASKMPYPEPNSIIVLIPAPASGAVIGKGGENIKEIIAVSGARVQLANKDARVAGVTERAVTISGTKEQQVKAGELVFNLMQETEQTRTYKNMSTNYGTGHQPAGEYAPHPPPVYSSYPPAPYRGYGGSYGAPPAGGSYGAPPAAVAPRAPRGGPSQTVTLQVPDSIVGALVGKGGKIIVEMQQQSGARIQISNRDEMVAGTNERVVTITGNDHAVTTAQYLVTQRMQQPGRGYAAPAYSPPGY